MTNKEDPQQPMPLSQLRRSQPERWGLYMRTAWNRAFGLNVSRIDHDMYVGGQFTAEQWPRLRALGIRAVLSLQEEYEDRFAGPAPERYLRVLVPDFQAPTLEQLSEAAAFIEAAHTDAMPVMVHCHAGMGRAPLTAAAYLVKRGATADDALRHIVRHRPIVGLNGVQLERLYEWQAFVREVGE